MIEWLKVRPLAKSNEERYVDTIKELDNIFLSMKKERDDLKKEVSDKDSRILELEERTDKLLKMREGYQEFLRSVTPVQVYHHKDRKNTTVKFLDGTSVTVHLMDGDEDSIETAIAYALVKKMWPKVLFKNLVKTVKEVGEEECKKD